MIVLLYYFRSNFKFKLCQPWQTTAVTLTNIITIISLTNIYKKLSLHWQTLFIIITLTKISKKLMSVWQTSHYIIKLPEIFQKTKNIIGGDRTHGLKYLKSSKKRFFLENGYLKGIRSKSQKVMVGGIFAQK